MKPTLSALAAVALLFAAFPTQGFSNAAVSPPKVPFKITADNGTKENRLVIPRKFLAAGSVGSAAFLGGDGQGFNLRTIIAGLAISVSLVSVVFLILRKKSRGAQAIAICIAVGASGFFWIEHARADGPPPATRDVVRQRSHVSRKNVRIEIVEYGDAVVLRLGTKKVSSWRDRFGPSSEPDPPKDGSAPPEKGAKPE